MLHVYIGYAVHPNPGRRSAWAFEIYKGDEIQYENSGIYQRKDKKLISNYSAFYIAIIKALKYLSTYAYDMSVFIFGNLLGAINILNKPLEKDDQYLKYIEKFKPFMKFINFEWIQDSKLKKINRLAANLL